MENRALWEEFAASDPGCYKTSKCEICMKASTNQLQAPKLQHKVKMHIFHQHSSKDLKQIHEYYKVRWSGEQATASSHGGSWKSRRRRHPAGEAAARRRAVPDALQNAKWLRTGGIISQWH
ncbi:hypothetical protein KOW79_019234 [Hemibagrus wyckioides]|uniref:Uncharacterized protein n=1 Tax=Hemibagrus wyckioides TaxID=337641 RepID=A0A9D3N6C9_9TELE|nr:hypothetical protein KOW79_019234 [Hemibagrus wyckioides]